MAAHLIIEVDGSQQGVGENVTRDEARTRWLESAGYRVIRFWNNDITNNMTGCWKASTRLFMDRPSPSLCRSSTTGVDVRRPKFTPPRRIRQEAYAPTLPLQGRVKITAGRRDRNMSAVPEIGGRQPLPIDVEAGKSYWWCACGRSKKQPFCDGSHKGSAFTPVEWKAATAEQAWFCACKRTGNRPMCDGSHKKL
jgi:CDGSH-type Zn-finger protein